MPHRTTTTTLPSNQASKRNHMNTSGRTQSADNLSPKFMTSIKKIEIKIWEGRRKDYSSPFSLQSSLAGLVPWAIDHKQKRYQYFCSCNAQVLGAGAKSVNTRVVIGDKLDHQIGREPGRVCFLYDSINLLIYTKYSRVAIQQAGKSKSANYYL